MSRARDLLIYIPSISLRNFVRLNPPDLPPHTRERPTQVILGALSADFVDLLVLMFFMRLKICERVR